VAIVAAAADVRKDEAHARVSRRQTTELDPVRRLLTRPLAPAVLPDVVQHRKASAFRLDRDRVEQCVVRAAARGELDANRAPRDAPLDLRQRVRSVVGVHVDVAAHQRAVGVLDAQHLVIAAGDVRRRGEVGGRGVPPAAEDGRDVARDSDPGAGAEARRIHGVPVGAPTPRVVEVGVHVD
jgi:hypothetical protein